MSITMDVSRLGTHLFHAPHVLPALEAAISKCRSSIHIPDVYGSSLA